MAVATDNTDFAYDLCLDELLSFACGTTDVTALHVLHW